MTAQHVTAQKERASGPTYDAWAVAAPGLEAIVADELRALGFADAEAQAGGASFRCDAAGLAAAQLGLRVASRVVVRVASFRATAFHELERSARRVDWARFVRAGDHIRLRVTCRKSRLYHSDAVAERVAEAVERAVPGSTSETTDDADDEAMSQLFLVRLDRDVCTLSADASGALLHRRGYRIAVARAPLRETLAAAMLLGAGWDPRLPLIDPLCGSGTIPIEAALLARRIAPGLARNFSAEHWPEMAKGVFDAARANARERVLASAPAPILASDRDAGAITAARANAERAGVADDIDFSERALSAAAPPDAGDAAMRHGLLLANPPYGIRIGDASALRDLFARLGQLARGPFQGWQVAMLSADRALESQTRLRLEERFRTGNGGIPVRLVSTAQLAPFMLSPSR